MVTARKWTLSWKSCKAKPEHLANNLKLRSIQSSTLLLPPSVVRNPPTFIFELVRYLQQAVKSRGGVVVAYLVKFGHVVVRFTCSR